MLLKGPKFRALAHNTTEFHKPQLTPFIHNEHGGEVLIYLCVHTHVQQKRLKKMLFWKVLFLIFVYPLPLVA